ncbi:unnamed protein product [Pieris macdunnoughi]|uniref:Uncharacterized protein n=1 Tax=Pieris macdunnoughi TaxID=345717 RepID=A0A821SFV2_9NEOP|nr:unnamed protein product [Pieris macdunnoughi]
MFTSSRWDRQKPTASHCGRSPGGRVPGSQRCRDIVVRGGVEVKCAGNWFAPPEASPYRALPTSPPVSGVD